MSTKIDEIRAEVKRLTTDLRIAMRLAKLKREQAEGAEERASDLRTQLEVAIAKLTDPTKLLETAAAEQDG
jgi:hypothetical protein